MASEKMPQYLGPLVQAVVGSEWLRLGYVKISSGQFPAGMARQLGGLASNNPNGRYRSLLVSVAIPNATTLGYVLEWAEILVGATLLLAAVAFLLEPGGSTDLLAAKGACAALAVGALMSWNSWLAGGWLSPVVDGLNYVMGLTQVVLLAGVVTVLMAKTRAAKLAAAPGQDASGKPAVGSP
jgi:hypothetical protein